MRKNQLPKFIVLTLTCVLSFVSTGVRANGDLTRAAVYVEQTCPVSQVSAKSRETGGLEIIALKVLGRVVEGAINAGTAMLKEAAKDESIKTVVANSTYLYTTDGIGGVGLNPDMVCLVFYSGNSGSWSSTRVLTTPQEQNFRGFSEREKLRDFPDFYFEALIEPSHDGAYFRLRPKAIRYVKTTSRGFGNKSTSAFLTLAFGDPSKDGDAYHFGSSSLALPALGPNDSILEYNSKLSSATGWIPMLALAPDQATSQDLITEEQAPFVERKQLALAIATLQSQLSEEPKELVAIRNRACRLLAKAGGEDPFCPSEYKGLVALYSTEQKRIAAEKSLTEKRKRLATLDAQIADIKADINKAALAKKRVGSKLVPVDLHATLVETIEAIKFLKILANAVGEVAPAVGSAARERIDPDEKAAKRAKEEAALQSKIAATDVLESNALTALNSVRIVEASLADLPANASQFDRETLESNLRTSKQKANVAFRKLGRPDPFLLAF